MDKDKRDQLLDEMLQRAGVFELMVASDGWKLVQVYYENKLKTFVNELFSGKAVAELETERLKLMGLKELMGHIDSHLQSLAKFREDAKKPTAKPR